MVLKELSTNTFNNNYHSEMPSFENEEDSKSSDQVKDEPINTKIRKNRIDNEKISVKDIKDEEFYSDPSNYTQI